jgi:hypothetical protein
MDAVGKLPGGHPSAIRWTPEGERRDRRPIEAALPAIGPRFIPSGRGFFDSLRETAVKAVARAR